MAGLVITPLDIVYFESRKHYSRHTLLNCFQVQVRVLNRERREMGETELKVASTNLIPNAARHLNTCCMGNVGDSQVQTRRRERKDAEVGPNRRIYERASDH